MLAPLNVDTLKSTFLREGCPYWWAYDANKPTNKIGQFRPADASAEIMGDSWTQLEYLINSYAYGHLLIKCKKNVNDNKDSTHYWHVIWGEELMPQKSPSNRRSGPSMGHMGGGNMNMGSMMMFQMFQMMMNQQEKTHAMQLESVKENMRLNHENQQQAAIINGTEEPSMQEYMLKETFDAVKLWLGPKLNPTHFQPSQQMGALGTIGQRSESTTQAPAPTTQGSKRTSFDAIMEDINSVYHSLGKKYEPNEITRALAIFCQQNAGPADQFIGPMIQQLRQHEQSQRQNTDRQTTED